MQRKAMSATELKRLDSLRLPLSDHDLSWIKARMRSLSAALYKVEDHTNAVNSKMQECYDKLNNQESSFYSHKKKLEDTNKKILSALEIAEKAVKSLNKK